MPGPTHRVAYNAKGRQSTAGSRKKGKSQKKDRSEVGPGEVESDPNASILVPKSKEDKDSERKAKLLQELAAQTDSKWTSKKKKRLEKYIDKKLKKEERVLIFDKLSKTQATMSSVALQSSATLGTGKPLTHQQQQDKAEDALMKKTLLGQTGKRKRHQDAFPVLDNESDDEGENAKMFGTEHEPPFSPKPSSSSQFFPKSTAEVVVVDASITDIPERRESSRPIVGSALHRNADGSVMDPRVRLRRKGRAIQKGWGGIKMQQIESESDTSFDSSDSESDASEGDGSSGEEEEDDEEGPRSGEDDEDDEFDEEEPPPPKKKRTFGFKDWAMEQLNAAKGYEPQKSPEQISNPTPSHNEPAPKKRKLGHDPTSLLRGPLGEDLKLPSTSFAQQILKPNTKPAPNTYVKVVEVKRPPEVEEARILLPIVTEEQPIMEAVLLNPIIIICGETGSGKTTQVPQFLYEAGFGTPGSQNPGMIGITQPRRVAAMSMASRVGHELSLTSSVVSYQIRYDATVSLNTSIKFMTDGVLLRELATDFLLTKYSVIIVDEAHERSINTDILIGVLSRVIKLREEMWKNGNENIKPLRLIIMSATLRVSDFAENKTLFPSPPPVINVAARQHPVTIHFSRRTYPDYVTQAIKKASKIHTRLPPGGILIFLTGQAEIVGVCRRLEAKFSKKAIEEKKRRQASRSWPTMRIDDGPSEYASTKTVNPAQADVEVEEMELGNGAEDDLAADVDEDMNEEDPEDLESDDDEVDVELGIEDDSDVPMHVIPLYSLLPNEKQMRVFEPPPPGSRLVVVSTNVAETSLTIPGIRYVIDCGRAKERHYDIANGIQTFKVSWIAKASAAQRAGRAGRTGPGHCYRLYSSALFEHHFENFAVPEIRRMPIEGVVLQMKSMHIDAVINFPFPTPPDRPSLLKAEKTLSYLGALKPLQSTLKVFDDSKTQITDLGRAMALFPLSPRFSRMLVGGQQHGCLPYVICIISALSVGDPFIYEGALTQDDTSDLKEEGAVLAGLKNEAAKEKEINHQRRKAFFQSQHLHSSLGNYTSDLFKMLSVVGAYEYSGGGQGFCAEHFVRPKAMEEIHKLRAQISSIVHTNFPSTDPNFVRHLSPPNDHQLKILRQLLTAGFIDQVAVRKDLVDKHGSSGTQYATSKNIAYRALGIQEDVFIHPSSLLAGSTPPDFLVYHEVVRTSKVYLKGLTKINPSWLSSLGKDTLCTYSKSIKNNVGTLMTIPRFGPDGWELPAIKADGL